MRGTRACSFIAHAMQLNVAQHRGLDPGKRKQEMRIEMPRWAQLLAALVRGVFPSEVSFSLDLRKRERHGMRIAKHGQRIDPRAAGIPEPQQFRDLVVGFARGIVQRAADQRVLPGAIGGWAR